MSDVKTDCPACEAGRGRHIVGCPHKGTHGGRRVSPAKPKAEEKHSRRLTLAEWAKVREWRKGGQ